MSDKKANENRSNGKKKLLSNPLRNNYVLIAISILIAFACWLAQAFSQLDQEFVSKTIRDIPIIYSYSQSVTDMGLEVIENKDSVKTVDVTISGKSYIVNNVSSRDLIATAKITGVTSAGVYTCEVNIANENNKDFKIVSWDTRIVNVRLDRTVTREFTVTVKTSEHSAADGYTLLAPTVSDATIRIKGPETEINQIASVVASADVPQKIDKTATYDAAIKLYDEYGEEISNSLFTLSTDETEITIIAMKLESVPVDISYTGMPSGFNKARVTISPKNVTVAAPKEVFENLKKINLGVLDFASLTTDRTHFEYQITDALPSGCTDAENIGVVSVDVNLKGMSTKRITVTNISLIPDSEGKRNVTLISESALLTITGPTEEITKLSASDFVLTVNADSIADGPGKYEVKAIVSASGGLGNCWINGNPVVTVQASN